MLAFERRLRFTRLVRMTDRSQTRIRTRGRGFESGWWHFLHFLWFFRDFFSVFYCISVLTVTGWCGLSDPLLQSLRSQQAFGVELVSCQTCSLALTNTIVTVGRVGQNYIN